MNASTPDSEGTSNVKTRTVAWLETRAALDEVTAARTRGEPDHRLSSLAQVEIDGSRIQPMILDQHRFPLNPFANLHTLYSSIDPLRAIGVAINRKKYDAIVSVQESSALVLLLFRRLLGMRTPILLLDPALDFSWRPRRWILDQVLPRADRVLVRGTNQARDLVARYGPRCRPDVVYHAIDTGFWRPSGDRPEDYIFSIGNDIARDFTTLLSAARGLNTQIVIKTTKRDFPPPDDMPNVRIIRERISQEELRTLYDRARFVVIPLRDCRHASGVNSVLEAMAMGKATIISRSEGIADYFREGETSLAVAPEDVRGLAQAIETLLDAPARVAELGASARRIVDETFSTSVYRDRLARSILDAIAVG